jgi:hypothetical protein
VKLVPKKFDVVFQNDILDGAEVICDLNGINHNYNVGSIYDLLKDDFIFPSADIVIGGFPCFLTGTKVLTLEGYKNIEDVVLQDTLLTHTGKFQNIVNLQRKVYNGDLYELKIKYHSDIITCTEEHPFYIREKKNIRKNKKLTYTFEEPLWKKARELTKNDYFGIIINTNEKIPEFTIDEIINQHKTEQNLKYISD